MGKILTWTQQTDSNPANAYDFEYDPADQLRAATWRTTDPTPAILKRYRYAYDPAGNRTVEQIDDASVLAAYDEMNRLQQHIPGGEIRFAGTLSEPAAVTIQSTPARVSADNRFELGVPVTSGTNQVEIQATDVAGNVRTNTYDVGVSGSSKTFTFDPNGNMTGDGTRTFEWDAANRLIAVAWGSRRTEFSYDGLHRRTFLLEKDSGVPTSQRRFSWCGSHICEERDFSGSVVVKRILDDGIQDTGTNLYYSRDHLGSIRELTDSSGALTSRYDFDLYGRTTLVSGSTGSDFTYTGHFRHEDTDLLLPQWRAYTPSFGRWLSEDPSGFADGLNLYPYVLNNPVRFRDPSGLAIWVCTRKASIWGANHAYIWDDRPPDERPPGEPRSCGMQGSSGGSSGSSADLSQTELGTPGGDDCVPVPGSEGQEQDILDCCKQDANNGLWVPWVNDCFNAVNDCLKDRPGVKHPGFTKWRIRGSKETVDRMRRDFDRARQWVKYRGFK